MHKACGVAIVGWLVFAACAQEHREAEPVREEPSERRDPESVGRGGEAGMTSTAPDHAGEGGSRTEPKPSAADGGERPAVTGATATAVLTPTDAAAAESGEGAVRGKAKFRQGSASVDLTIQIGGCAKPAKRYPVFVQAGGDCSEATLLGPHWDGARGEGIAGITCIGTAGSARVAYSRANDSDLAWSLGRPARSNLIGRALAIYDPETQAPLACGVIELDPPAPADAPAIPPPPVERAAPIAGLCLANMIVRDSAHVCPDPNEIVKCASEHCDLNACVQVCSSYLDCLGESDDPCSRAFSCDIDAACSECYGAIQSCSLSFCADVIACAAPPVPDGACSKLEACCALQGEKAEMCLDLIQSVKKLSGEPSCIGIMQDWDFFSHLEVACEFE